MSAAILSETQPDTAVGTESNSNNNNNSSSSSTLDTKPFDATDPKYRLNDEFLPDKEGTWKHPAEKDGWIVAHNSLRREMSRMVEALKAARSRGANLRQWEVECIRLFWSTHSTHVHAHHHNEDDLLVPFLRTRFQYPEKTVTDHVGLVALMDQLDEMTKTLKAGEQVTELLDTMEKYQKKMIPHLLEEEVECLPLMRAYFAPEEVAETLQVIVGKGPKVELGSLIECMGEERWRNEFMLQESIPDFVWDADFKGRLELFRKEFETPVDAVVSGKEPEAVAE